MRVVQVVPGSGDNFYCENCVRDNGLIRALHRAGHDVVVVPMYLPQTIDKLDLVSEAPIFFGGINAYLQQRFGLFRKTPRWLDRLFDTGPLLRFAARRAGSVRAAGLGEMTLSILAGTTGNQAKELRRLLDWLAEMPKPDLVHLSSPLLLGIGAAIKERFGVPLVCSVQDEHVWLDGMAAPWADRCWAAMADSGGVVDAFIAVSRSFGEVMCERMRIPPERMHVAHIGIEADETPGKGSGPEASGGDVPARAPVIGFLARMSKSLGLGILVDAFLALRADPRFAGIRLHVSGGSTADDHDFLVALRKKIAGAGATGDVQWFDTFDREARRAFFRSLTVLSVPTEHGTAFGTYILESLAARVPVVQPRVGAFPELVDATGGGVLYEPNEAATLAGVIADLLSDRDRLRALGEAGRAAVLERFSPSRMVKQVVDVYGLVTGQRGAADLESTAIREGTRGETTS